MSLITRLWIALWCVTLAAWLTATGVHLYSAQQYLENELRVKNHDAAHALALSVSQQAKDSTSAALLVSAQFDLGHYRWIEFLDPQGRTLQRREGAASGAEAPGWFVQLVPIVPVPGKAEVQSGWQQLGMIRVQSEPAFAYGTLWRAARNMALLFMAGCAVVGILGTLFIRSIVGPLLQSVEQARALADRRYVEVRPPRTREFRYIIEALNHYSRKIKMMLDSESRRLERLKATYERDALTGFMVREVFLRHVAAEMQREDAHEYGCLVIIRMGNLAELNQEIGRLQADAVIQMVVVVLRQISQELATHPPVYGRLGATDLGLLLPGYTATGVIETQLRARCQQEERLGLLSFEFGAAVYGPGMSFNELLMACDQRLSGQVAAAQDETVVLRSEDDWLRIIAQAFSGRQWRLSKFPVQAADGKVLHRHGLARIESEIAGGMLAARAFLPWVARQGMVAEVDYEILQLALDEVEQDGGTLSIPIGFQTLCDERVMRRYTDRLVSAQGQASRLILEVAEAVAFGHYEAFDAFARKVAPLGCGVAITHLDHQVGHIGRLHGLGIHHLKVSRALTQSLDTDVQAQVILRVLCTVAHSIDLQVVAQGVEDSAELELLYEIGFDGACGYGVV